MSRRCFIIPASVLASASLAQPAFAAFGAADTGWEGCSQLVALAMDELGESRVRVIESLDYSVLQPGDALVFLHPTVDIRFQPLAAFLAAGGRAAVIDDYGKGAALLERFHIHRANPPTLPSLRLHDNPLLPIAVPASSESAGEPSDHPTLRGVDQVVTNHPTALRLEPGIELTPLLVMPARGGPEALLAVTGVIGDAQACGLATGTSPDDLDGQCGRLLAMGDPSAFINLMLRYPGNSSFARGVFRYLLEDDTWGRRGGNLYVLSGDFKQSGSYGGAHGLRETLNEQQAALLEWLAEVRSEGLPEPFSIALAAIAAIGVAIWAGLSGGQPYSPVAPGYARTLPAAAQGGFAGRVAVLGSKSTDRSLILRELKRGLEALLRERLGVTAPMSPGELVRAAAERNLLQPRSLRALEELLAQLSAGEIAVMHARRLSLSDRKLQALHAGVLDILTEMIDQENPKRDSRPQHG